MADLPELTILREQMHGALAGKSIALVDITQPGCLNVPIRKAKELLAGKRIVSVEHKGKWLTNESSEPTR